MCLMGLPVLCTNIYCICTYVRLSAVRAPFALRVHRLLSRRRCRRRRRNIVHVDIKQVSAHLLAVRCCVIVSTMSEWLCGSGAWLAGFRGIVHFSAMRAGARVEARACRSADAHTFCVRACVVPGGFILKDYDARVRRRLAQITDGTENVFAAMRAKVRSEISVVPRARARSQVDHLYFVRTLDAWHTPTLHRRNAHTRTFFTLAYVCECCLVVSWRKLRNNRHY